MTRRRGACAKAHRVTHDFPILLNCGSLGSPSDHEEAHQLCLTEDGLSFGSVALVEG
jgi:hypothetical protein